MSVIEFDQVSKQYGSAFKMRRPKFAGGEGSPDPVKALDGLTLDVGDGDIYGFLGPNGAGKSTTINILLGFVTPNGGNVSVFGHDPTDESVAIRERTGVLPEGYGVYERASGKRHIELAIKAKDVETDPRDILERVGLEDDEDRNAGAYSTGMKQRLALGMALVGDPDLLILDEPMNGLDPNGARELREIIRAENERGATVFFSSHSLDQVEAICNQVGIIRNGSLIVQDTIKNLRNDIDMTTELHVTAASPVEDTIPDKIVTISGVSDANAESNELDVTCTDEAKPEVISRLEELGVNVNTFESNGASLEDLFASYTTDDNQAVSTEVKA